jgi:2,4-dienoyl-CoA reductase (NADPH2)
MKAARELVGTFHDHGARIGAQLHKLGVRLVISTRAIEITDEDVLLVDKEGRSTRRAVESVILAVGSVSRNELVHEVEDMVREVHVIGDASRPRNALFAIREAVEAGRRI